MYFVGLVDAEDSDDFQVKLQSIKDVWDLREKQYLPKGMTPKFYKYISGKVSVCIENMIANLRNTFDKQKTTISSAIPYAWTQTNGKASLTIF